MSKSRSLIPQSHINANVSSALVSSTLVAYGIYNLTTYLSVLRWPIAICMLVIGAYGYGHGNLWLGLATGFAAPLILLWAAITSIQILALLAGYLLTLATYATFILIVGWVLFAY